jgi:DNA replication protein DnaC
LNDLWHEAGDKVFLYPSTVVYGSKVPIACQCPRCDVERAPVVSQGWSRDYQQRRQRRMKLNEVAAWVPLYINRLLCERCETLTALQDPRKLELRLEEAGIPKRFRRFTLDSFPEQRSRAVTALRDWLEKPLGRSDLVLFGDVGTGKTGLATSLLRAWIERGHLGRFVGVTELVMELRATFVDRTIETDRDVLDRYALTPLLVLDELSAARSTPYSLEVMQTLVNLRHEAERPLVITTNLNVDEMEEFLDSRVWDRLRSSAVMLKLTGPSRRP